MLKRTIGFLLIIALIQSVAPTPAVGAASAEVILTHIQPGVPGGATKEYVILFNNGDEEVELTDWCLRNKSGVSFACFRPEIQGEQFWLRPGSHAVISSMTYKDSLPVGVVASLNYAPTSQSSGSMVGSSDTVTLVNAKGVSVDTYSWVGGITGGAVFMRTTLSADPLRYATTWSSGVLIDLFLDGEIESRIIEPPDLCSNLEGIQTEPEPLLLISEDGTCERQDPPEITIRLNELLPNPAGADSGKEYIELYNYGLLPVNLNGLRIQYGATGDKSFIIQADTIVEPGHFFLLWDFETGFTLPNSSGVVRLLGVDETIIDDTSYVGAKDDQTWAWFEDGWRYTKNSSPGGHNIDSFLASSVLGIESTLKPCAANQYRHPETGRCRLIASSTTKQVPCRPNQTRNPTTGRCKNIAATSTPMPCKAGQERSPETNRCRTIRALATTNYDILEKNEKTSLDTWYIYTAIGGVILALLGYAAWEWRAECRQLLLRLRWSVLRR